MKTARHLIRTWKMTFWNQVFLYRKDGNYTIDNSLAERCIRPLANAEEPAVLRQRQDGACQRGLPLHRVHLQAVGALYPRIPQEVLCRNRRRQSRLRKTYALDHRHKCKQTINFN